MGMYDSYYMEGTDMVGVAAIGVIAVVLLVYLAIIGLGIANYIMNAMALSKIASRRQIPNSWMAWLPIASDWLIGHITDEYDGRNGIKRKWRIVLLTLSLISVIGLVVLYIVMFAYILILAFQSGYAEPEVEEIIGFLLILYGFLLIISMIAVTQSFCKAICIYKIFESTVPNKAVTYLLLYLLVPLAGAICLLKCKDKGYPELQVYTPEEPVPQYTTPAEEPIEEVVAEQEEEAVAEVSEEKEQSE